MFKFCVVGTRESLDVVREHGIVCIEASNLFEAGDIVVSIIQRGFSPVYITEEFYDEIYRYISENKEDLIQKIRQFPSVRGGDIGAMREIMMMETMRYTA